MTPITIVLIALAVGAVGLLIPRLITWARSGLSVQKGLDLSRARRHDDLAAIDFGVLPEMTGSPLAWVYGRGRHGRPSNHFKDSASTPTIASPNSDPRVKAAPRRCAGAEYIIDDDFGSFHALCCRITARNRLPDDAISLAAAITSFVDSSFFTMLADKPNADE